MLNIIEAVTSILEMDKELERIKLENTLLKETIKQQGNKSCNCNSDKISTLDKVAIKCGKKKLFDSVFYYGNRSVEATRNDDEIIYTSFDEWTTSYITNNEDRIPIETSIQEIIEYFNNELMNEYQSKCKYALEKLLEREQKSKEDEE